MFITFLESANNQVFKIQNSIKNPFFINQNLFSCW